MPPMVAPKRSPNAQDASFSMCQGRTRENYRKVRLFDHDPVSFRAILTNYTICHLALGLDLDVMVLDFEDGVALNQKAKARQLVAETLKSAQFGRTERTVRINSIKAGEELYVDILLWARICVCTDERDFLTFQPRLDDSLGSALIWLR